MTNNMGPYTPNMYGCTGSGCANQLPSTSNIDAYEGVKPNMQSMPQMQMAPQQTMPQQNMMQQGTTPNMQTAPGTPPLNPQYVPQLRSYNPTELYMQSLQGMSGITPPKWTDILPITPTTQPIPITPESLQYLNGFLRTQLGKRVTVEFLLGTNTLVDRTGILMGVGANYIVINETDTDDILVCDFFNIKFVKIYY